MSPQTLRPLRPAQGKPKRKKRRTKNREQKTLPDQIRAVRTVLETLPTPANPTTIAKHFKGARKDRIEAILESLQALGHAHEVEGGRWAV